MSSVFAVLSKKEKSSYPPNTTTTVHSRPDSSTVDPNRYVKIFITQL
jgi:hypothetical protein